MTKKKLDDQQSELNGTSVIKMLRLIKEGNIAKPSLCKALGLARATIARLLVSIPKNYGALVKWETDYDKDSIGEYKLISWGVLDEKKCESFTPQGKEKTCIVNMLEFAYLILISDRIGKQELSDELGLTPHSLDRIKNILANQYGFRIFFCRNRNEIGCGSYKIISTGVFNLEALEEMVIRNKPEKYKTKKLDLKKLQQYELKNELSKAKTQIVKSKLIPVDSTQIA